MQESPKCSSESDYASDEMKRAISGTQPIPSNQRVFVELLEIKSGSTPRAFLLTTERAYVADDDKITVYDVMTRLEIKKIAPIAEDIWDISLSRDGKSLFVACREAVARIVNLDTGDDVFLRGHTNAVRCIIQGEGADVLTCSFDKTIRRWNSSTGECLMIYQGHTECVNSILYDEDTNRIFSASSDMTIIALNSETGEKIGVIEGHYNVVGSLARVNSTTIASGSYDATIKLWNTMTLACIKTISNGSPVSSVATTLDGQYLISGGRGNKVKVWSVATGQCMHTFSYHKNRVSKVAVSSDGRFIASGGEDHMFHLFSVSPSFLS